MDWELSLEFCLPAGPNRMEQSWPARNANSSHQSKHLTAQVGISQTHLAIGCSAGRRKRDRKLTLVPKDLEGFVQDRSKLVEYRATPSAKAIMMCDLRLWHTHPIRKRTGTSVGFIEAQSC
jgi:hypothetical protein